MHVLNKPAVVRSQKSLTEFETHSGKIFDYQNPDASGICINDIAQSLSRLPRFLGHSFRDINVALHSVWVSRYLYQKHNCLRLAMHGLLHDAHEAYLGDIPTPMANHPALSGTIKALKKEVQTCIYDSIKLPLPSFKERAAIEQADEQALLMEAFYCKATQGRGWSTTTIDEIAKSVVFVTDHSSGNESRGLFLHCYHELLNHTSPLPKEEMH